jgi:hypothetical protein
VDTTNYGRLSRVNLGSGLAIRIIGLHTGRCPLVRIDLTIEITCGDMDHAGTRSTDQVGLHLSLFQSDEACCQYEMLKLHDRRSLISGSDFLIRFVTSLLGLPPDPVS